MTRIKIVSNPYEQTIDYYVMNSDGELHIDYATKPNSKLLNDNNVRGFFPFNVKNIVDIIINEYHVGNEKISLEFEGTDDEFGELVAVCLQDAYAEKIELKRSDKRLANARDILPAITTIFKEHLQPIISESIDKEKINVELKKFSDASEDTVPICILGNYSAGKSTFINSLIGSEILPSGDEPITAKIYQIKRSIPLDRASIELEYEGERFKITFRPDETDIIYTGGDKPLYNLVKSELDELARESITVRVNKALGIINGFDKNDEPDSISNLISIQVPFVGGLWNNTDRDFVIFDTPGSNSASNDKHLEVLKEQMSDLSNGLPIFLSEYDSLDSTDNERLYNIIREVKELDSRFTMIVVNKADTARIPKGGFTEGDVDQILAMAVPKNLYNEGIYFVSSIVGLGSKNDGEFIDDHYAEIFEGEERKYSDPGSRFYKELYKNNIMPEQLKKKAIDSADEYEKKTKDLIYVNSGLFSVENEILTFAENYSHYNKCKQANLFLDMVIDDTAAEIHNTKYRQEDEKEKFVRAFEADKQDLVERISKQAKESEECNKQRYIDYMRPYVEEAEVVYATNQIEEIESQYIKYQKQEMNYEDYQVNVLKAKVNLNSNLKENVDKLFKKMSFDALKELSSDLIEDLAIVNKQSDSLKDTKHSIDRTASDELLDKIKADFINHTAKAQSDLEAASRAYWDSKSAEMKNELITVVAGSEALSEDKKTELTELILSYEDLNFENIAENTFIRDDFERGIWIGKIKIVSSDRLDISKLVFKYNAKTIEIVNEVKNTIASTHENLFDIWMQNLLNRIFENIVELNTALKEKAETIQAMTEKISELETRQIDLGRYTEQIRSMLDWSTI